MPIGERLLRNPDAHLPLDDMECPDLVRSHIRGIVERCGAVDQLQRPTMQEVRANDLTQIAAQHGDLSNPLFVQPQACCMSSINLVQGSMSRGRMHTICETHRTHFQPTSIRPRGLFVFPVITA